MNEAASGEQVRCNALLAQPVGTLGVLQHPARSAAGNPPIFASLTLLATFEVALRPIRRGFSPLMARGLGGMALLAVQMDARRHSSARPPSREPPRVGRRPTRRSASSSVRWPVTRLREIRVRAPSSGGLRGIVRLKAPLAGKR